MKHMTTWPLMWLVQLWHITIWPLMWLVQPSQNPLACLYKPRVCSNKLELLRCNPCCLWLSLAPRGAGLADSRLTSPRDPSALLREVPLPLSFCGVPPTIPQRPSLHFFFLLVVPLCSFGGNSISDWISLKPQQKHFFLLLFLLQAQHRPLNSRIWKAWDILATMLLPKSYAWTSNF